jgi:hypothetical protein
MDAMHAFDYMAPAELFTASHRSKRAALKFHRFATSAEAIRFAMEGLSPEQLYGTVLEVGDTRFDAEAIRQLYGNAEFPLERPQLKNG